MTDTRIQGLAAALLAATAGVLGGWLTAHAAIGSNADEAAGRTISYSGYVEDSMGPADGSIPMYFEAWDSEVGGVLLWQSGATLADTVLVPISAGRFTIELGGLGTESMSDAVFSAPEIFLSVTVNGTSLAGRQRVGTARRAEFANRATGALDARLTAADLRTDGHDTRLSTLESREMKFGMAQIWGNLADGSLTGVEQLQSFIQSTTFTPDAFVDVRFVPGFFTIRPLCVVSPLTVSPDAGFNCAVEPPTADGVRLYCENLSTGAGSAGGLYLYCAAPP